MTHYITGIIPTPMSDPDSTFFSHHESTAPKGKREIGEENHVVTVATDDPKVADVLESVFSNVFATTLREERDGNH